MQKQVATFEKNSMEEVRVTVSEWKGQKYLDIRTWVNPLYEKGEEAKPTKKGITLNAGLLPDLMKALKKAGDTLKKD